MPAQRTSSATKVLSAVKLLGLADDLTDLIRVMRERRIQLGLSQLALDDLAGLPSGYVGKQEAMLTNPRAKNARGIGRDSLPLLLAALGLQIGVIVAPDRRKFHAWRKQASLKNAIEISGVIPPTPSSILSERASRGGKSRAQRMSPAERQLAARAAAAARWARRRDIRQPWTSEARRSPGTPICAPSL